MQNICCLCLHWRPDKFGWWIVQEHIVVSIVQNKRGNNQEQMDRERERKSSLLWEKEKANRSQYSLS